jgi:integrase/recombinase XerD
MNTLREAVGEYLDMRRGLGFKLREAGKGLIDFVTFLEQRNASYITQPLALTWAQQPSNAQPAYWAQRLSFVREFARFRSATDPRTRIPLQGLLPFEPAVCCGPLSGCPIATSAVNCDRGSIIVYSDC